MSPELVGLLFVPAAGEPFGIIHPRRLLVGGVYARRLSLHHLVAHGWITVRRGEAADLVASSLLLPERSDRFRGIDASVSVLGEAHDQPWGPPKANAFHCPHYRAINDRCNAALGCASVHECPLSGASTLSDMSDEPWHLDVGSDVENDEFYADVWYQGRQWASVVERDGDLTLIVHGGGESYELDLDAALESLEEAKRRVAKG
jgi:hypothetical protein